MSIATAPVHAYANSKARWRQATALDKEMLHARSTNLLSGVRIKQHSIHHCAAKEKSAQVRFDVAHELGHIFPHTIQKPKGIKLQKTQSDAQGLKLSGGSIASEGEMGKYKRSISSQKRKFFSCESLFLVLKYRFFEEAHKFFCNSSKQTLSRHRGSVNSCHTICRLKSKRVIYGI